MPLFSTLFIILSLLQGAHAGETRNVGSASTLSGHVHMIIVFLSDENSRWTRREQKNMLRLLQEGERWLLEQSMIYPIQPLQFSKRIYGKRRDIKLDSLPSGTRSGNENVYLVQTVAEAMGYENASDIWTHPRAEQSFFLLMLKRDGASYAIPQEVGLSSQFDTEGAVIYQNFDSQTPNCASCIAHEILHLFGAWDFYQTFQTSSLQQAQAEALYPNSVMLRTSYKTQTLTIDPVTSWRIGWSHTMPDNAMFFEPVRPQQEMDK